MLSAGTDIQKDAEGKPQQVRVVNLLVTPDQAQILSLASSLNPGGAQGHIQLVLRNPLDTDMAQVAGTGMAELFSSGASAPVGARAARWPGERPRRLPQLIRSWSTTDRNGANKNLPLPKGTSENEDAIYRYL